MKKCANKWNCLFSYMLVLHGVFMVLVLVLVFPFNAECAEEMYIITTRNGLEIMVKKHTLTDEYVEFTTPNDLPGFIKKEEFVKISNMVGVPPTPATQVETIDGQKKREIITWLAVAAVLFVLYIVFLVFVIRKKKNISG